MICAKAAILKFFGLTLIPCDFSVSISLNNTSGSITTPEPIIEQQFFCITPDGIKCSLNVSSPTTTVWPALLPP